MFKRIQWIDIWKGIGIATVVVGHVVDRDSLTHDYIFWFHMPLFFFISGHLYRQQRYFKNYFRRKFRHLIIPYISFLFLFSIPEYLAYFLQFVRDPSLSLIWDTLIVTLRKIYGGRSLSLWFDVFWFITCLFFTQQIYNLLYLKYKRRKLLLFLIISGCYGLALCDSYFLENWRFPWNINVVAIALSFYGLGHFTSRLSANKYFFLVAAAIVAIAAIFADRSLGWNLDFDMKYKDYGIPLLSWAIAIAGITMTYHLAKAIDGTTYLGIVFAELGKASMAIMYLHQPIQFTVLKYSPVQNPLWRSLATLIFSYLIYRLLARSSLFRKLFLGNHHKTYRLNAL
ncbi:acyltransferase family protein [Oxynema sp. CENA135]|uniref:acyltransferase family protein n=1 Tax=Oxynema sp. CENA135 TaxID=984206 RepID=UPI001909A3C3|nr:acyltransferase family protein [Oxynema sp. CENA135]MBK4731863.1 acyltransferase family protein [Oxynema sp. CENA135]